MESPEDIEKALSRLMPSAISGKGQRSLDELIDKLADGESTAGELPRKARWPWAAGIGAAAAALAAILYLPSGGTRGASDGIAVIEPVEMAPDGTGVAKLAPPAEPVVIHGDDKTPWLGLRVGRTDEAIRAHVPRLPEGTGYLVTSVDPGGPAEKAGMKPYDILWKFDDQLIANEAQLVTLLRLRKEGDEVPLGIYRSGEEMTLSVVLETLPEKRVFTRGDEPAGAADAPMKVLNPAKRTAEIELPDGKAVITMIADAAEVKIVSSDGVHVFEGPLYDLAGNCQVPDPWKPRVEALERALVNAIKGEPSARLPEVRIQSLD